MKLRGIFSVFGVLGFLITGCTTQSPVLTLTAPVFPLGNQGANIFSAYAVVTDTDGNYYVPSQFVSGVSTHIVTKYDSHWKTVYVLGTQSGYGTGTDAFYYPSGLAVKNDKLYVADRFNHRIKVYQASTGTYLSSIGSSGTSNGQFNEPIGLQIFNSKIYVADSKNNRIQVFDLDGTWLESHGTLGVTAGLMNTPYDITQDKDGNFWVADRGNLRVEKFDSNWTYLLKVDSSNGATTSFNYPAFLLNVGNRLYVSDLLNKRIVMLDLTGTYLGVFQSPTAPYVMSNPRIPTLINGKIVIPDLGQYPRVFNYEQDGTYIGTIGAASLMAGEFISPRALKVTDSGDLFVGDAITCRLQKFNKAGTYQFTLGSACVTSPADGVFTNILSVDTDSSGNIYVVESAASGTLQKFSPSGTFLWRKSIPGTADGQISPVAMRVSGSKIYVLDASNPRVSTFDLDGNYVSKFQTANGSTDGLLSTSSSSIDVKNGYVYVSEYSAVCRIQKFDLNFTWVQTINLCTAVVASSSTTNVRVNDAGDIYYSDFTRNRVVVLTSAGTVKTILGTWDNTKPSGIHYYPFGIDFDSSGNVYVAYAGDGKIIKMNSSGSEVTQ